eukprot:6024388-Pleurochrysis_carterae.AAC.1
MITNGRVPTNGYSSHQVSFNVPFSSVAKFKIFCNYIARNDNLASGIHNDPALEGIFGDLMPTGWDLMASLYDEVRIYGASITVEMINYKNTGDGHTHAYIYLEKDDARRDFLREPITNAEELRDSKIPGIRRGMMYPSGSGGSKVVLKKSWTEKMMPLEDRVDNKFNKGTVYQAASQRLYHFVIGRVPGYASTGFPQGYFMCTVTYMCKWEQPKTFLRDDNPDSNENAVDMNEQGDA